MSQSAEQLLQEALRLPANERSELAAKLIDSLDPTSDGDAETAWSAEIQQRLQELQSGQVQPIPWPEARRLIVDDSDESSAT